MSALIFGGTLALKGAIEEQRTDRPSHCEDGCVGCLFEAALSFEHWRIWQQPSRPIIHKERHRS